MYRNLILDLCTPYLAEIGSTTPLQGPLLYRGMTVSENVLFSSDPSRKPRGMPELLHDLIDEWFLKHHGWRYRSAYVVFCTGDASQTVRWGPLHAILPFGVFRYCWSPDVADLTDEVFCRLRSLLPQPVGNDSDVRKYWQSALKGGEGEVAGGAGLREQALCTIQAMLDEFESKGTYRTSNLRGAIASGKEVMLVAERFFAYPCHQHPA